MTLPSLRSTIMPFMALAAVAYLVVMVASGARPQRTHFIEFEARGVMAQRNETIVRVNVTSGGTTQTFMRQGTTWVRPGKPNPVDPALGKSIDLAVQFMHTAAPVRMFKPDEVGKDAISEFGLARPELSIRLDDASGFVLEAQFGDLSRDGMLHYMRARGRNLRGKTSRTYYLMSRFVLQEWRKIAKAGP